MANSIAILGAGNSGLAMAAHFALNGEKVRLWNRSLENIRDVIKDKKIHCTGVIEGVATLDLVSTNLIEVVKDVNMVFVATPAIAHNDIAKMIAAYTHQDMTIILCPGRTFGVIDFINILQRSGCQKVPKVVETQTIVYTCRKENTNKVNIIALKHNVMLYGTSRAESLVVIEKLPECIKGYFVVADSMIHTSLGNVGMILHCAPVLMNIGWIENHKTQFKYYYDGITESIADFLEILDTERLMLAEHFGVKIESVTEWMRNSYDISGTTLYECIQNNEPYKMIDAPGSIKHRYITEDIPCGLVPLECLGYLLGIRTPLTTIIIDLANSITKSNFREIGRIIDHDDIELLKKEA